MSKGICIMKIYFAAMESHNIKFASKIAPLLSYYDIHISTLPFRKKTWQMIVEGECLHESVPCVIPGR